MDSRIVLSTHFSVVDAEGNAVANTYTLNFSYDTAGRYYYTRISARF